MIGTISIPKENLEDYFRDDLPDIGLDPNTAEVLRVDIVSGEVRFMFRGESLNGAKNEVAEDG